MLARIGDAAGWLRALRPEVAVRAVAGVARPGCCAGGVQIFALASIPIAAGALFAVGALPAVRAVADVAVTVG